jgi:pilus assembly protein CpaC
VGVQFAPTVLGPDRIYLEVSPEVSQPDFTLAAISGGALIPGFITRKASTSVELADGQSFAIAGLLSDQVNSAVEKYPLSGDIPVLGVVFRSVQFQRNETELVMIVTPRIVKPCRRARSICPRTRTSRPTTSRLYMLGALESQREVHPKARPTPARRPDRAGRTSAAGLHGRGECTMKTESSFWPSASRS